MSRKPATFRHALASGFSTAFLLVALGLAALFAPAFAGDAEAPVATPYSAGDDALDRPLAPGSPQALAAAHTCWTGEAPAGVIPTHVVARTAGDWHYSGGAVVDAAFEQLVFDGTLAANEWTQPVDHGMKIAAFCK